jgi:glycerol-3-phosphate acyltransferase PlsY
MLVLCVSTYMPTHTHTHTHTHTQTCCCGVTFAISLRAVLFFLSWFVLLVVFAIFSLRAMLVVCVCCVCMCVRERARVRAREKERGGGGHTYAAKLRHNSEVLLQKHSLASDWATRSR